MRCFDSPSPDAADAEPLGRTFIRSLEIDLSQRSRSAEAGVQSLPATRRVARTIYPLGPTPSGLGGGAAPPAGANADNGHRVKLPSGDPAYPDYRRGEILLVDVGDGLNGLPSDGLGGQDGIGPSCTAERVGLSVAREQHCQAGLQFDLVCAVQERMAVHEDGPQFEPDGNPAGGLDADSD